MKIFATLFLVVLIANTSLTQVSVAGQVIDAETNEPLPYVNIGVMDSNKGTVSDDNGNFNITIDSSTKVLAFSYVGYEGKQLIAKAFDKPLMVALKPNSIFMEEVRIVNTHFDKEILLGSKNEKGRGRSIGFGNAQLGTELGARIKIEKETFVKSVNFVLNHAKGDSLLLRVNIYDYQDGTAGEKLLSKNIFIKDKQRKGLFTINVEDHEIMLHNDVLLTLEWLRDFNETGNKLITFDTKKSRKYGGTFIRNSKTSSFIQLPYKKKHKPCIYFIGKQSSN